MSHSVTIRTQTVSSSSTAFIINSGYMKTWSGAVKLLQLVLGIVCVSIIGHQFTMYQYFVTADLFFLLITTAFLIGTGILLISCLTSHSTATIIAKTIYELIYHSIAFGLYLSASLTFLVNVTNRNSRGNEVLMAGAICGLVNSALYFLSTIIAVRLYKGH
ncbi:uncharacterized protein LOC116428461 [Nomia melanderi]|uniref:uncharacterized protein LOC116428461 n=1 Tax=Nomia melanderi TaxID=2448451 RepID=UPI0013043F56|nr:uncharacterized protein LOC116428461 [Nomia melanderi]XP_031835988.1 uncharacterized protein LOC116428461 [Nomia melanderi]XP_031835989.1 uncharacterized protein LOC116428461 [Nomia melanderi]